MPGQSRRNDYRLVRAFNAEVAEFKFPLSTQQQYNVSSVDISVGGVQFECGKAFEKDIKLQIKIYIPSFNKYHPGFFKVFESDIGQYIQAIAEVRHTVTIIPATLYKVGATFLDVDHDDATALQAFISRHKTE